MGPLKVIDANGDLATAASHNAPAELLPCGQRLQPRQVLAKSVHCNVKYGKEVVVGNL